jgi:hypothetical protein
MTQKYLNELIHSIIGAAIDVHKELGPGLLESIYEKCMMHLLRENGLKIVSQQKVPLVIRKPKGILINFNCTNIFREGQKTLVTEMYAKLPKGY